MLIHSKLVSTYQYAKNRQHFFHHNVRDYIIILAQILHKKLSNFKKSLIKIKLVIIPIGLYSSYFQILTIRIRRRPRASLSVS